MSDVRLLVTSSARRFVAIAAHLTLWATSGALALLLRFDFQVPRSLAWHIGVWLPTLLACRTATFARYGLYRGLWRYTGARDLIAILKGTTMGTALFALLTYALFQWIPRSIVAIEWMTAIVLVGGARFAGRAVRSRRQQPVQGNTRPLRILIVGAGDAGETLIREIQRNYAARYTVVGFIDDDTRKLGAHIHDVRVLGRVSDLPRLAVEHKIDEVLIAMPSARGTQMRRVVEECRAADVRFQTIPGLHQLIDGRVSVNQLRDVAIEDLLGRAPVELDMEAISRELGGEVIMVTGAGGSIGSEICRQLCRFQPSSLLLVERAENSLFHVHRELQATYPDTTLVPCVADVADETRMAALLDQYRPAAVFHAAAHKHVPMMEWNPGEAVKNNVFGTRTLADLADRFRVNRFVMISTDKAVNPTSIMGASKRVAEIYVQALSQRSSTRFVTVRFGNVLGSNGSVVPIFREQIASGGPVTVTHPEMTRYFMTIPEASQLVLQAGAMGNGGEIFILDMGEPVRIANLARDLISLSGLRPNVDIEVRFTGIRPGEKLFEELSVDAESADKTKHPKIFVGRFRPHSWDVVQRSLRELRGVVDDPKALCKKLTEIIPEYHAPPAPRSQTLRAIEERPAVND